MINDTSNPLNVPPVKPLSPKEERAQEAAAMRDFLEQFETMHPRPQTDVEAVMYSGSGRAEQILVNVIRNIPLLLIVALVSVIILTADKTGSIFAQTHLLLPAPIVGFLGWLFMSSTLLITSFGGELERIRSNRPASHFTLLEMAKNVLRFIGILRPKDNHGYSMAGFANMLMTIEIVASVAAVWLTMEAKSAGKTQEEMMVAAVMSLAIGAVAPLSIHKLGCMLASHGNRALQQEIENITRQQVEAYEGRFQAAWESYWNRNAETILQKAFLYKNRKVLGSDGAYMLAMGGDEDGLAAVPLAKSAPYSPAQPLQNYSSMD